MRRGLAWLVAVPLLLAGSQVAHVLAYRLVYPDAGTRLSALVRAGHGYMGLLPFALGAAAAVVLVSLGLAAADAARGRGGRPLPPWAFALLPVLAWTVQELLERRLSSGLAPWHAAAAPTFLPGRPRPPAAVRRPRVARRAPAPAGGRAARPRARGRAAAPAAARAAAPACAGARARSALPAGPRAREARTAARPRPVIRPPARAAQSREET